MLTVKIVTARINSKVSMANCYMLAGRIAPPRRPTQRRPGGTVTSATVIMDKMTSRSEASVCGRLDEEARPSKCGW